MSYEPTVVPARSIVDGLGLVLTPSAINQILLRVCIGVYDSPPSDPSYEESLPSWNVISTAGVAFPGEKCAEFVGEEMMKDADG